MATQRRKRTPKKAAPKRTIWRTLFWLGFKLSLVGAAFMVVFGIYLDTKVRERFDGEVAVAGDGLQPVAGTLSQPAPLPGPDAARAQHAELQAGAPAPHPGEYAVSGNRIELIRR